MGKCEKTFVVKICDDKGATSSTLSGESAYTHKVAKDGLLGGAGELTSKIPKWRVKEDLGPQGAQD